MKTHTIIMALFFILLRTGANGFAQSADMPPGMLPHSPPAAQDLGYRLQPQDEIHIRVFGEDDLSGSYKLAEDGAVTMPLIGAVNLAGLARQDAALLIEDYLAEGYLVAPDVVVEIVAHRPVYIMGEVERPGRYDYEADMSVLSAVAMAGGFTYRANRKNVEVQRAGDDHDMPVSTTLAPGDIVTVKERFF